MSKTKLQIFKERKLPVRPGSILEEKIMEEISLFICKKMKSKIFPLVTIDDLKSSSRKVYIINVRFVCMWIIYYKYEVTLKQIGEYYGDRDYSTIICAINQLENWYDTEAWFQRKFDKLLDEVNTLK